MKYEFQANYNLSLTSGRNQLEGIDYIAGVSTKPPHSWAELGEITDQFAKLQVMAQANLTDNKDYARTGRKIKPSGLMALTEKRLDEFFKHQYSTFLEPLNLVTDLPDMTILPFGSWGINFKFKLIKPYISKDDTDFYIIDNPVKKEWVFKVPYIAPTQWKGTLRSVMGRQLYEQANSLTDEQFAEKMFRLALLSGSEKEENPKEKSNFAGYFDEIKPGATNLYRKKIKKHFGYKTNDSMPDFRGRLHFYPTYFTKIGLEVINPHDRETGTGTNPIYFETVPAESEGIFTLLYVPIELIGNDKNNVKIEVLEDLSPVADGIKGMMTEYGFGAKTSSGFGLAESKEGKVIINIPDKNKTYKSIKINFLDFMDLSQKADKLLKEHEG